MPRLAPIALLIVTLSVTFASGQRAGAPVAGAADAGVSNYLVDPDARLVMVYMIQQMPNRTDLAQLIPALVYQALTDPPRTK
jgi:CubicO group peptidase (beta-lactamase class C family)